MTSPLHTIVLAASQLIQADFADPHLDPLLISQRQQVDPGLLDTAFLHCRGRRCSDEIAITRASRLFKLLGDNPEHNPEHSARSCGFVGLHQASEAFQSQLGIELGTHLHTSQRALEDRLLRREDPRPERLILESV